MWYSQLQQLHTYWRSLALCCIFYHCTHSPSNSSLARPFHWCNWQLKIMIGKEMWVRWWISSRSAIISIQSSISLSMMWCDNFSLLSLQWHVLNQFSIKREKPGFKRCQWHLTDLQILSDIHLTNWTKTQLPSHNKIFAVIFLTRPAKSMYRPTPYCKCTYMCLVDADTVGQKIQ